MNTDLYQTQERPGWTIAFVSRGCRKYLQKNPALTSKIADVLSRQGENGFYHAKLASRKKWQHLPVLECRINDSAVKACRAAFAVKDSTIYVLYLSGTLLKKEFTQEMDSFLKGEAA